MLAILVPTKHRPCFRIKKSINNATIVDGSEKLQSVRYVLLVYMEFLNDNRTCTDHQHLLASLLRKETN